MTNGNSPSGFADIPESDIELIAQVITDNATRVRAAGGVFALSKATRSLGPLDPIGATAYYHNEKLVVYRRACGELNRDLAFMRETGSVPELRRLPLYVALYGLESAVRQAGVQYECEELPDEQLFPDWALASVALLQGVLVRGAAEATLARLRSWGQDDLADDAAGWFARGKVVSHSRCMSAEQLLRWIADLEAPEFDNKLAPKCFVEWVQLLADELHGRLKRSCDLSLTVNQVARYVVREYRRDYEPGGEGTYSAVTDATRQLIRVRPRLGTTTTVRDMLRQSLSDQAA